MPNDKRTSKEVSGSFAEFRDHIIAKITKLYHLEKNDVELISNIIKTEGEIMVLAIADTKSLDPASYVGLSINYLFKWEEREKGFDPLRFLQFVENPKLRDVFKGYAKIKGAKQMKIAPNPVAKYVQVMNKFFANNIFNKPHLDLVTAVLAMVKTTNDIKRLIDHGIKYPQSFVRFIIADCVTEAVTASDLN